ncbi:MAG: hypothetical protein IJU20_04350 [Clostridia bacterium]|nr:hypothetical protein [Clostridia bacterium]
MIYKHALAFLQQASPSDEAPGTRPSPFFQALFRSLQTRYMDCCVYINGEADGRLAGKMLSDALTASNQTNVGFLRLDDTNPGAEEMRGDILVNSRCLSKEKFCRLAESFRAQLQTSLPAPADANAPKGDMLEPEPLSPMEKKLAFAAKIFLEERCNSLLIDLTGVPRLGPYMPLLTSVWKPNLLLISALSSRESVKSVFLGYSKHHGRSQSMHVINSLAGVSQLQSILEQCANLDSRFTQISPSRISGVSRKDGTIRFSYENQDCFRLHSLSEAVFQASCLTLEAARVLREQHGVVISLETLHHVLEDFMSPFQYEALSYFPTSILHAVCAPGDLQLLRITHEAIRSEESKNEETLCFCVPEGLLLPGLSALCEKDPQRYQIAYFPGPQDGLSVTRQQKADVEHLHALLRRPQTTFLFCGPYAYLERVKQAYHRKNKSLVLP